MPWNTLQVILVYLMKKSGAAGENLEFTENTEQSF